MGLPSPPPTDPRRRARRARNGLVSAVLTLAVLNVAFAATVIDASETKSAALYWTPEDTLTPLARAGTSAPGGGTFAKFTSLAYPGGGISHKANAGGIQETRICTRQDLT